MVESPAAEIGGLSSLGRRDSKMAPQKASKYDQVVHLIFFDSDGSRLVDNPLIKKEQAKGHGKFIYFGPEDFDEDGNVRNPNGPKFNSLKEVTHNSKLKIYGHSSAGLDVIASNGIPPTWWPKSWSKWWPQWLPGWQWLPGYRHDFTYSQVANVLNLIPDTSSARQQKIKVTLIACEGGKKKHYADPDSSDNASFAEKLAKELIKHQLPLLCSIQAAKTLITGTEDGSKIYESSTKVRAFLRKYLPKIVVDVAGILYKLGKFLLSPILGYVDMAYAAVPNAQTFEDNSAGDKPYSNKPFKTVFTIEPRQEGGHEVVESSPAKKPKIHGSSFASFFSKFAFTPDTMPTAEGCALPAPKTAEDFSYATYSMPDEPSPPEKEVGLSKEGGESLEEFPYSRLV